MIRYAHVASENVYASPREGVLPVPSQAIPDELRQQETLYKSGPWQDELGQKSEKLRLGMTSGAPNSPINNSASTTNRPRGSSFSTWLFGTNSVHHPVPALGHMQAESAIDGDEDASIQPAHHHKRSSSLSEALGLSKVPSKDEESILRGDFH